jgi:hypothetical protein
LRKRESPVLPCKEREEEERPGSLGRLFLYHLELRDGETLCYHLALLTCGLREEPLNQEVEQSQTIPNLGCLKLLLRDIIPKILLGVAEEGQSIFSSLFELTRDYRPIRNIAPFLLLPLGT